MIPSAQSRPLDPGHTQMMQRGAPLAVILTGPSGANSPGMVRLQTWNDHERLKRGLKFLGLYWGLALCSVILPVAHFVLVPSLLLAGPIIAYAAYKKTELILGGEGSCPECRVFLPIARTRVHWPLSDHCSECMKEIKIALATVEVSETPSAEVSVRASA